MKIAIPLLLWSVTACSAHANTIHVAEQIAGDVKPGFLRRVESATLREALDNPGKNIALKPGKHHLSIPCDNSANGSYAKVAFIVEAHIDYQLTFMPCGVYIKEIRI